MHLDLILEELRGLAGVLELAPTSGSEYPEIAWGDHFFYYAPDGEIPINRQPYATVITKNYPDDQLSLLDEPGRWRLNIHVGIAVAAELTHGRDFEGYCAEADVFLPHPLYGKQGWVCVVSPSADTTDHAIDALRMEHDDDRRRFARRGLVQ